MPDQIWPTPSHCNIHVHYGQDTPSSVQLPVWDGGAPLERPLAGTADASLSAGVGSAGGWVISSDIFDETHRLQTPGGGEFGVSDLEPAVAFCSNRLQRTASWPGVDVVAEATGTLTSDAQSFHMSIGLRVMLNGELFHTRQWSESVPRALM